MANTTMNVSISEELKAQALAQVRKQHFSTASDYIQSLIRQDIEKEKERLRFEAFVQEGIESGEPVEISLTELRERLTARLPK